MISGKLDIDSIKQRYTQIRERLKLQHANVTLVAISKKKPVEAIEALYHLGHRDFGENYVQELVEKAEELDGRGCKDICWHFVGHLQRNKVKPLLRWAKVIHSVDSERLAVALDQQAEATLPVFLEVNIDAEEGKSGLQSDDLPVLAKKVHQLPKLQLLGLMCIPKIGASVAAFQKLREMRQGLGDLTAGQLSMGMSADYQEALSYGATHLRLGRSIFGERD